MKNSILSLEGVEVLSKKQMKNVGGGLAQGGGDIGGERCETISMTNAVFYQAGEAIAPCTLTYRCRPTILGVGVGSWSEPITGPHFMC